MVAKRTRAVGEPVDVAVLVERVACVARETAEEVGPEHRRDERPEAAARLPRDAAVLRRVEGAVALVDEWHDLAADVRVVVACPGRVDVLRAAERGPRVDVDDDHGLDLSAGDPRIRLLGERPAVRRPVPPHGNLPRVALEDVDGRIAALGLVVVAGRHIHPERSLVGVAERIAAERFALERVLVDAPGERVRPGLHRPELTLVRPRAS